MLSNLHTNKEWEEEDRSWALEPSFDLLGHTQILLESLGACWSSWEVIMKLVVVLIRSNEWKTRLGGSRRVSIGEIGWLVKVFAVWAVSRVAKKCCWIFAWRAASNHNGHLVFLRVSRWSLVTSSRGAKKTASAEIPFARVARGLLGLCRVARGVRLFVYFVIFVCSFVTNVRIYLFVYEK